MPVVVDSQAPPQLTSLADLMDVLGRPLTADETERGQRRLDRAQALLTQDARLPNFLARVVNGGAVALPVDPGVAAEVIATMVARQWRNPDGVTTRSVTVGPYGESVGFGDRGVLEQSGRGELLVTQGDVDKLIRQDGFPVAATFRTTAAAPTVTNVPPGPFYDDCGLDYPFGWR